MAAPNRKTRKMAADDSSSETCRTYAQNELEIEATFEGHNLERKDYFGVKLLLQQLFLKAPINTGQISKLLIKQQGIGTVLKQVYNDGDDEETAGYMDDAIVFAVTSVIDLSTNYMNPGVMEFYQVLDDVCLEHEDKTLHDRLESIFKEGKKFGLLINERFLNLPAKISSNMLNVTFQELEDIKKKNKKFDFDYLIIVAKTSRKRGKEDGDEIYRNEEELVFAKAAHFTFEFSVESEAAELGDRFDEYDDTLVAYRRVIFVKAVKCKNIIDEINTLVNQK